MNDRSVQEEVQTVSSDPRRLALRSELEATRAAFQRRLQAAAASGWDRRSPSSAWTLGEIFVHLTWALEYLPEEINRARQGRGMFNLPKPIADPASYWYIRWLARRATPAGIARRYDLAMEAVLALLETIPKDEWGRGANFYAEGFHSVEHLFHTPAHHLAAHTSGL